MNTINNFLIEKLTLNDESKTKGAFRSRRRNRIDSSSERKAYLKFMEFFEALSEMPGLKIALCYYRSSNDIIRQMNYKVKYSEDLTDLPNVHLDGNSHKIANFKVILGHLKNCYDSYEDIINNSEDEDINSIFIYKSSLDAEEINDIEKLNIFIHYTKSKEYDGYAITFIDLLENIDEINSVFVD